MDLQGLKYLVVGAGFYGAVMAERIASVLGEKVLIIDRRDHIGGNSHSSRDPRTQIEIHTYGSHIFHTSNEDVWAYLNRFTSFNSYQHTVWTRYQGRAYPMPINLQTINSFYGLTLTPEEARRFMAEEIARHAVENPANLEEKAISLIGRPIYEAFIRGYTKKQWETDPRQLPASIITRLPFRLNYNARYFNDKYEGLPVDGYGTLFEKILAHPLIETKLGIDYFEIRDRIPRDCRVVYTGPIDRFFDHRFGRLGWRTVDLKLEWLEVGDFQGCAVMNEAEDTVPFTRTHEFRHYHPERTVQSAERTVICREYPRFAGEHDVPAYPIDTAKDKEVLRLYRAEAEKVPNVLFGGRLGNYVYVDMHQAIAMALNAFQSKIAGAAPAGLPT